MNELETVARAKMYIEKLANGVNPLDDSTLPAEDIVNNVRISRCLFFVSDLLRQVIDNGGINPPKAQKKDKFYITADELRDYPFSETAIVVSRIAESVNLFIDTEKMKKISHKNINDWLISLGFLTVETRQDGSTFKKPTQRGTQIGISQEHRMGQRGEYDVNLYNLNAQHFIVDNIEALVSFMHYTNTKSSQKEGDVK